MAEKKPFVLRISPETLRELEAWAAAEFRSVNGQIEYILSEAVKKRKKGSRSVHPREGESNSQ